MQSWDVHKNTKAADQTVEALAEPYYVASMVPESVARTRRHYRPSGATFSTKKDMSCVLHRTAYDRHRGI